MRKKFAPSLALGLLLALMPAAPVPAHEVGQEVMGTVIAPPLPAKNVSRGGRSLVIISQMLGINGVGGYYFAPDPATLGAPFVLKPVATHDVDVFFYADLGDLTATGPTIVGEHTAENTKGEAGFVPPDTKWVVIYYGTCLQECVPAGGAPAYVSFAYRAEKTPVVTIAPGVADLGRTEVHAGGSVYFDNPGAEEVTLQSARAGEFASEPFTGKVLLDVSGLTVGEYAYTVSNGAQGTLVII